MNRVEFDVKGKSEFHIKSVGRALYLKAWDLPKVRIDFFDERDTYEQKGNKITLSSGNDCIMRVPADSSVVVGKVGADANVKGISGALKVERVGGSLYLKRLGDVAVEHVGANLTGRDIAGELRLEDVMGNASLKNVRGDLIADKVRANFDLRNGGQSVKVEAMGNANVRTQLADRANYHIKCAGNAYCKLEAEEDVQATLKSGAEQILVVTPTQNQSLQTREHVLTLGGGSASVSIEAGGHIDFQVGEAWHRHEFTYDLDSDLDGMVGEISDQISVQLETQLESLESQLESLSEHIQTTSSAGLHKAQKRIAEAQRRMEQRLRARAPRGPRKPVVGVASMQAQPDPVTEEERMKVLEMVQEKKITVEEAEVLLATLEGRKVEKKKSEDEKGKES